MPTTLNVKPSEVGRLMRAHELERQQRVSDAVYEAASEGVAVVRARLPVDRGPLRESVNARRAGTGPGAELRIDAPYSIAIEAGAPPHRVPLGALFGWVSRHTAELGIATAQQLWAVAKGIQNKIAREGQRPHWAMRGAMGALREGLDRVMRRRLFLPPSAR